jgi:hypothetical protein
MLAPDNDPSSTSLEASYMSAAKESRGKWKDPFVHKLHMTIVSCRSEATEQQKCQHQLLE